MKATSNATDEVAHGRTPAEMFRPATTTRNGFTESQGAGVQLIMTARLALEMGVPIYSILGMTATATDKISRSIPLPAKVHLQPLMRSLANSHLPSSTLSTADARSSCARNISSSGRSLSSNTSKRRPLP